MYRVLVVFFAKHLKGVRVDQFRAIILFAILVWFSASGFLYFELPHKPDLTWKDSLWWTFVTMTTIGYGDHFPVSTGGRFIVGLPVMIFGIGFLGYIISAVAARLIESRSRRLKGMASFKHSDHIVLINYPSTDDILRLVEEIRGDPSTAGKAIVLVDEYLEEIPRELAERDIDFVRGDPVDQDTMDRAAVDSAAFAVVLCQDRDDAHTDGRNLATVLVIERVNPRCRIVAEVRNPRKARQFEQAGCESTICVSDLNASLIVQELQDPGVKDVVLDLVSNKGGDQFYIIPMQAGRERCYRDLLLWGMENRYAVLGIRRGSTLMLNCPSDEPFIEGDRAVLVGSQRLSMVELG